VVTPIVEARQHPGPKLRRIQERRHLPRLGTNPPADPEDHGYRDGIVRRPKWRTALALERLVPEEPSPSGVSDISGTVTV
jgi:hypothetical protein